RESTGLAPRDHLPRTAKHSSQITSGYADSRQQPAILQPRFCSLDFGGQDYAVGASFSGPARGFVLPDAPPVRSKQRAEAVMVDSCEGASRSHTDHQARHARHDHADTHQRPDEPQRAGGPLSPDQDAQDQGDDAVHQDPHRTARAAALEIGNQVDDAFRYEEERQRQGETGDTDHRMQQEVNAHDQIQNRYQEFPDRAADALRLEGMDKLERSAKNDEPRHHNDNAK